MVGSLSPGDPQYPPVGYSRRSTFILRSPRCVARRLWHNHAGPALVARPAATVLPSSEGIMRNHFRSLASLVGLVALAVCGFSLATAADGDKIKVIIIDGQNNHN